LNNGGKKKKKWKNVCKIVATLVCSAGARNTLGPKLFSLAGCDLGTSFMLQFRGYYWQEMSGQG
jgi:hypothetical protein